MADENVSLASLHSKIHIQNKIYFKLSLFDLINALMVSRRDFLSETSYLFQTFDRYRAITAHI